MSIQLTAVSFAARSNTNNKTQKARQDLSELLFGGFVLFGECFELFRQN
jgi:hypothetical protein